MRNPWTAVFAGFWMLTCVVGAAAQADAPFDATWESLEKHDPAPEWFRDAKFGIYFHWGVYSVPAFGSEWYPRNMHLKDQREYKHHVETWGDPAEFGYHDFVPMFKAEKFDADEWAELFAKAGARFAGPVAEHHDGFAMWASKQTPWNAGDKGPKRDITGELEKAIRARGMKFVTTFHHARNSQHKIGETWTGHYPRVEGWPTVTEDPELRVLYGNIPRADFLEMWKGKLVEVIDNYRPDLIWFDSWFNEIPDEYQCAFLAHYFNRAAEWDKDVVVTYKQRDLPDTIGVEDLEKGRMDHLTELAWLTDDTISKGSWCYTQDLRIKPASEVIHVFIDIVSKNGQLLLNISPMADGAIPATQRDVLLEMGKWLDVCGEAIYGTRPFATFGEGPTRLNKGGHFVGTLQYTPEDIRFTRKGNVVYAICLGWPAKTFDIAALGRSQLQGGDVRSVSLLGSKAEVEWVQKDNVLRVTRPEEKPCDYAYAFKIELDGCAVAGTDIDFEGDGTVRATVHALNLSEKPWRGTLELKVDGKTVDEFAGEVAPGDRGELIVRAPLDAPGFHTVSAMLGDTVLAERTLALPVIRLARHWRFHRGDDMAWKAPNWDDGDWDRVKLPAAWEDHSGYIEDPAYGWYRLRITIPKEWKKHDLILPLGRIDDVDATYFNGELIGASGKFPPRDQTAWQQDRRYRVPAKRVRFGDENVIAVRVYDSGGGGGMLQGPLGPVEIVDKGSAPE